MARFIRSTLEENHTLDWELLIPAVAFSYNTAQNAAIKTSPFRILFGLSPRYPINDAASLEGNLLGESFGDELAQRIEHVRRHAERFNMTFRESYTENFNKDKEPMQVRAGQKVLLHSPTMALRGVPERKANVKFLRPWVGPYVVKEVHNNNNLSLWLPHRRRGQDVLRVHTDRCKLFREPQTDNNRDAHFSLSHQSSSHVAKTRVPDQQIAPQLAQSSTPDQQNEQTATWNKHSSAKTKKLPVRDESEDDEENDSGSESGSTYSAVHAGREGEEESRESENTTSTSDTANSTHTSDADTDTDEDDDGGDSGDDGPSPPVSLTKNIKRHAEKFARKVQQALPKRTPARRAAREVLEELEDSPEPGPSQRRPGAPPAYSPARWAQQPFATRERLTRAAIKTYDEDEREQQFAPSDVQQNIHRRVRSDKGKSRRKPDEQPPPS